MALSVSHPVSTRDTNSIPRAALSVSHPVSTRDTNIIPSFPYHIPYQPETPISSRELLLLLSGWYWCLGLIRDVIRKEPYHIMFIIYLNMRKSCSVLWTFSYVINIILRGTIKGWWYRYQSRQTNTVVMFFQYYICKFPLFSTKYMINISYHIKLDNLRFNSYHWVNICAGRLLITEGSVRLDACFSTDMVYWIYLCLNFTVLNIT